MKKKIPKNKLLKNKILSHKYEKEETKNFFLEKSIDIKQQAPSPYLLEDEFAKSKVNRKYLGLFILLISCSFLIIFAFFIVSFYEERQEKINLKIEEFSDIDLEDVLRQASSFKNELLQKKENLFQIQEQKKNDLEQIAYVYDAKVKNLLNNDNVSDEVRRSRSEAFLNQKQQEERDIIKKYEDIINDLRNETDELAEKVNKLDQTAIDQAVKTGDFMGYQEKLLEANIKSIENSYKKNTSKIINNYERRINKIINSYNPSEISSEAQLVLDLEKYKTRLKELDKLKKMNLSESTLTENSVFYEPLLQFKEQEKETYALLSEINKVPFYNKTREISETLNLISSDYFNDLNNLFLFLSEEEKKKSIFLDFINFYLEKMGYVGVVVEIKNRKGTMIINEIFQGENFTRGFFFSEDTKKKISDFKIIKNINKNENIATSASKHLYQFEMEKSNREITLLTPVVFYNNKLEN